MDAGGSGRIPAPGSCCEQRRRRPAGTCQMEPRRVYAQRHRGNPGDRHLRLASFAGMERTLMTEVNDKPSHSLRVAIVLTVVVGAISTAVAYFGARESTNVPRSSPNATDGTALSAETIVLPQDEPEIPAGPHQ